MPTSSAPSIRSPACHDTEGTEADADATNIFGCVVAAAEAGATHGEICSTLRRELGFGQPLTVV